MRRSPFYRIFVIVLCYAFFGIFLFLGFGQAKEENPILFWVIVGVYGAALIGTIIGEEISTALCIKKLEQQEEAGEEEDESAGS